MALIRVVAFDFGHTLLDEQRDASIPLESRAVHLMPEVSETLPRIPLPKAVWANTRTATGSDLQRFLDRAGIGRFFAWVVTSVDADFGNPRRSFLILPYANAGLLAMRSCSSATNWIVILLVGKTTESAQFG